MEVRRKNKPRSPDALPSGRPKKGKDKRVQLPIYEATEGERDKFGRETLIEVAEKAIRQYINKKTKNVQP